MQKFDSFYVLILFLFSALLSCYFSFDYHLSGVTLERQKVTALENKVKSLELVNEALRAEAPVFSNSASQREVASISSVKTSKEISFDTLFKNQLFAAVNEKNPEKIISITQKIVGTSANEDLLAQALFQKAHVSCNLRPKIDTCLTDIEALVAQFPESKWAGESLVMLSSFYLKMKRFTEADAVIKIVKSEFSGDKSILQKVNKLEKNRL